MRQEIGLAKVAAGLDEHHGELLAINVCLAAILRTMPPDAVRAFIDDWMVEAEHARTALLNSAAHEATIASFERAVSLLGRLLPDSRLQEPPM